MIKLIKNLSFSGALEYLKDAHTIYRSGWDGRGLQLELQRPDKNSKMGLPYIYIKTVTGELVPWSATNTDILEDDWCVKPKHVVDRAEDDYCTCDDEDIKRGLIKIEVLDKNLSPKEVEEIEKEILKKLTN